MQLQGEQEAVTGHVDQEVHAELGDRPEKMAWVSAHHRGHVQVSVWRLSPSASGSILSGYSTFATAVSLVSVLCGERGEIPGLYSFRVIRLVLVIL